MAQLSIFDKQRHHSDKDMTVSIGKNEVIYITFRNDAWKLFTKSEKIAVRVTGNYLTFGDPEKHDEGVVYKLGRNTSGFPETTEHTRYLQIKGKVWPAFLDAARSMLGSVDLESFERYCKGAKTVITASPSEIIPTLIKPAPRSEDHEKAIREAADELVDFIQIFIKMVIDAYKAST